MNAKTNVCEMCLLAAGEEGLATEDERELLCVTLGSEIGDHLCEEIEGRGEIVCRCSCHEPQKRALRREMIVKGGGV